MGHKDGLYMQRCLDLAYLGGERVRPNPMVGAVLVHNNRIIGEGYHEYFGGPHAEVNAVNSVKDEDKHLIPESTSYVSLEPCNFYGKTPACSDLILREGIKNIVVSCKDPNPKIAGSSLQYLEKNGVKVRSNVLEDKGRELIKVFSKNILTHKPYVILKYAQSKDFLISKPGERTQLSNDYSNIKVHKLRSEVDGILIGTNTALIDNPELNVRHIKGKSPVRIVIDKELKLPQNLKIFSDKNPTIIINEIKDEIIENVTFKKIDFNHQNFLDNLLRYLFESGIYVLLIEGGAITLQNFIAQQEWDEAIIITSPKMLTKGIKAPAFEGKLISKQMLGDDEWAFVNG